MAQWLYVSTLAASLVALLGLAVQFCIHAKLKAEFRKALSYMATQDDVAAGVSPLSDQMAGLEVRLDQIENYKREQQEWIAEAESINLNRRGQVLRLHQRGESIPDISSRLRVAQGEVRLIIKVFELSAGDEPADGNGVVAP